MERIYPVNIFGVKNIGIEEWLNSYFVPVTGREHQTIYENVFHEYVTTLKKYGAEDIYWLALSNIKLTFFISRYIFNILRLSRLEEAGYEYVIGQGKERISYDFSNLPELANFKLINGNSFHVEFQERARNLLSILKHNLPVLLKRNFFNNFSNPCFLIGGRTQKEVASYCRAKDISPVRIYPLTFARSRRFPVSGTQNSGIHQFVHEFLSKVGKLYPFCINPTLEQMERNIEESFEYSLSFFADNARFLKKFNPGTLLVMGIGNSIHRVFCSAWRYAGGEVVGFVHGNAYCTSYNPAEVADGSLSVLDRYIASSRGHERILKQASQDFSLGLKVSTEITHADENMYYPLFKELQEGEPVREIKQVMVIGFPMNDKIYAWVPEGYSLSFLHLELRLVKLLRNAGYRVIYKAHPDRIKEVEGIFDEYADIVLKHERFEDVFDMADCLLFSHAYTTTFGFSLLTKKPVVLLNTKGETWYPRALELLRKRCCIVNAEPDNEGRILFKDQDVINAINSSLNNINYDILHEFAF